MCGISVFIRKTLSTFVSQIMYELEIGMAIKMNKVLFNMEKDIVLICVYLEPSESPFWKSKTLKGIPYLEEQVSDIIY